MAKYAAEKKDRFRAGNIKYKEGKNGIGGRNEKRENKSKRKSKDDKED